MRTDYLAFFVSLFLSRLGDQILLFLVPLIVFQTTDSASWAGLAFFMEALPRYLAFPVCGALCDRHSPVRLLHISQVYRAGICAVAMALYGVFGGLYWLVLLSAVCGVLTTQGIMAREVVMPHAFPDYRYGKTLSYSQIADQTGLVLGPVLAALALEICPWPGVVVGAALLFGLADLAMRVWQRVSGFQMARPQRQARVWHEPLRIALGHIASVPSLQKLIGLAVGVNLIVGVTLATSAAMVIGSFGESKDYYAIVQAAGAAVTIAILFVLARIELPLKLLGAASYCAIVVGALITATGAIPGVYLIGFLLIVGFDKMFNIYMRTLRQRLIPVGDFGKTVGVITLLNNLSQPFAGLMVGLLTASLGLRGVILVMVLVAGLLGALIAVAYRASAAVPPSNEGCTEPERMR
ncbi:MULTISPECIES: MFS transporter [unclassified Pseudomonas]|uniref:MFS transporter n=1 Tax=unclassified Pseudomonas TaxID=196821 RepID=UPI000D39BDDC|nr:MULTISPECIES: MFS transporter [unclassified Pseudomonas]RAU46104.1 MFS transporter [Pseudomonas sp. RIT 409]RAU53851.1 MFS transporter [Pseudomonas sp. RIT 412]